MLKKRDGLQRFKETGRPIFYHDGLKRLEDWGWAMEPVSKLISKMITNLGAPVFSKNG